MHCVSATTVAIVNIEKRGEDMNVKKFQVLETKKVFLVLYLYFYKHKRNKSFYIIYNGIFYIKFCV